MSDGHTSYRPKKEIFKLKCSNCSYSCGSEFPSNPSSSLLIRFVNNTDVSLRLFEGGTKEMIQNGAWLLLPPLV